MVVFVRACRGLSFTLMHKSLHRLCTVQRNRPRRDGELNEALTNQSFIALALLAATSLVAGFFAYIYQLKRRPYLLYWTAGWAVVALSYLGPVLSHSDHPWPLQTAVDQFLYAAAGIFFFLGAQLYAQR